MATTYSRTEQLLNRLRMRQVALLLAIDEFRTLHAAAQHLGMTQPAASKMLHELEEALGETLPTDGDGAEDRWAGRPNRSSRHFLWEAARVRSMNARIRSQCIPNTTLFVMRTSAQSAAAPVRSITKTPTSVRFMPG